jgi:UDP-GlcNAc:undecaprenyl-phosphate GlcNAc-1-phosphate transferase
LALDGLGPLSALALACAGACAGFLRFNWQPARVFMGDGGALGLGFLSAGLSFVYLGHLGWRWNGIVAVALAAALPFADVSFTLFRRLLTRRTLNPVELFAGDRYHFYDQMRANAGMSVGATVRLSCATAFVLAVLGVVARFLPPLGALLVGLLGVALLVFMAFRCRIGIPRPERAQG